MVSALVLELLGDSTPKELNRRDFVEVPSKGDFISMNNQENVGMYYEVIARGFGPEGKAEIFVVCIGDNQEFDLWLTARKGSGFNG